MNQISYREGYKFQLWADYSVEVPIYPDEDISTRYVKLTAAGLLTIREDFAWDGPSGPTQDTPDGMRASLTHDALYSLMCDGKLEHKWRNAADSVFRRILHEDGMDEGRCNLWYQGVAAFGEPHTRSPKPVLVAPRPMAPYRPEWPGD